ncbi:DUF4350 domain-containing protein [Microbacterium sediminicola]|uniref:DUF4350 domain-containing protein n=1 Tax=Microbacterium sediminicola TaxID=415210 RepID=A0ABP4TKK1_9MICO
MSIVAPIRASRRVGTWGGIALVLLLVGALGAVVAGGANTSSSTALDPRSAAPEGTRALAQVLADRGVEVQIVDSYAEAIGILSTTPATLVLPDAPALSDDTLAQMTGAAHDVVLIEPRSRSLRLVSPDAQAVGVGDGATSLPECAFVVAERAGAVGPTTALSAPSAQSCYPVGEGYGLLVASHGDGRIVAVDATELFTNETITANGNAALALGLMGAEPTLVWYVPSLADSDLEPLVPSLGDLTPPWVTPVLALLAAAAVAAALWRGIRFGPLVSERLPVTVRGSETGEGRAHLYERSRDLGHVAHLLRRGTRGRLARMMGLGSASSPQTIAAAVADTLSRDAAAIRATLDGETPHTRGELDRLHEDLLTLEADTHAALHPERIEP